MDITPFFSIVMPVYGVEAYLESAVSCVLAQTYSHFELILVDDCSPDRSGEICDKLAQRDGRIRVLHLPENGGLSNARNRGMKVAGGDFIGFFDSDDETDPCLLSAVAESLAENPAHVVVYGLCEQYYNKNGHLSLEKPVTCDRELINSKKLLRRRLLEWEERTLYGYAWNKFYDLGYIRQIGLQFEKITLIEDVLFNVKYFMDIDSVNTLEIAPYYYKKRIDNSLTSKFVPEYYELHKMRVQLILNLYKYWDMCTDEIRGRLAVIYTRYIYSALQRNCDRRSGMNGKARKQWIRTLFDSDLFCELMPHAHASGINRLMTGVLKNRSGALCRMGGRLIYTVKTGLPMLFSRLK